MTNDHGGRDTSSLNDIVRVRGQGDQGTTITGGIIYPRVVAAGVSGFSSGRRHLPAMMNDATAAQLMAVQLKAAFETMVIDNSGGEQECLLRRECLMALCSGWVLDGG